MFIFLSENPKAERWEAAKRKLEGADSIFEYVFPGVQTKLRDMGEDGLEEEIGEENVLEVSGERACSGLLGVGLLRRVWKRRGFQIVLRMRE